MVWQVAETEATPTHTDITYIGGSDRGEVTKAQADRVYSDISNHLANTIKVSWWLGVYYELTDPALEACEVIRGMCKNIERLQQIQRNGYSSMADMAQKFLAMQPGVKLLLPAQQAQPTGN